MVQKTGLLALCGRSCNCRRVLRSLGRFCYKNHLPIGLLAAVFLGALWPVPGVFLSKLHMQYFCVVMIFLFSGLKLKTDDIKDALKSIKAVLWGLLSILFLTVVLGMEMTKALSGEFDDPLQLKNPDNTTRSSCSTLNASVEHKPFGPQDFNIGLQVFFAMPCTISSGIVLVSQVGGNYALSLLLTVIANLVSVATIPPILGWLATYDSDVSLNVVALLIKLLLTILLPLLVGKAFRYFDCVVALVKRFGNTMKLLGSFFLIMLPFMKISSTGEAGTLSCIPTVSIFCLIGWSSLVHIVFLILNGLAAFALRLNESGAKAVVIQCSQKSLAVGLGVISFLPSSVGDQGLLSIPAIISHMTQLIIDSVLVLVWQKVRKPTQDNEGGLELRTQVATEEDRQQLIENGELEKEEDFTTTVTMVNEVSV